MRGLKFVHNSFNEGMEEQSDQTPAIYEIQVYKSSAETLALFGTVHGSIIWVMVKSIAVPLMR